METCSVRDLTGSELKVRDTSREGGGEGGGEMGTTETFLFLIKKIIFSRKTLLRAKTVRGNIKDVMGGVGREHQFRYEREGGHQDNISFTKTTL